jgi:protein arginine kinase
MKTARAHAVADVDAPPYAALAYSSRVRLARNLQGMPFPGWAGVQARAAIWSRLRESVLDCGLLERPLVRAMGELDLAGRTLLLEERLISAELAAGDTTAGLIYEAGGSLSCMVNEEDHVRLQSVVPGFSLPAAWAGAERLHAALERRLAFAFSHEYGYLTACPSNVGTGIRASVMVHLAGLRLMGELEAVIRGLERTGYAVRGASGEGSCAYGSLYPVSNQKTLGCSEAETLSGVQGMVETLLQVEYNARLRLQQERALVLQDAVGRAYGLIRHAGLLTAGDALEGLSAVWLGLERGVVAGVRVSAVRDLLRDVQPGHLQVKYGGPLGAMERDRYRADFLREALATMEIL